MKPVCPPNKVFRFSKLPHFRNKTENNQQKIPYLYLKFWVDNALFKRLNWGKPSNLPHNLTVDNGPDYS